MRVARGMGGGGSVANQESPKSLIGRFKANIGDNVRLWNRDHSSLEVSGYVVRIGLEVITLTTEGIDCSYNSKDREKMIASFSKRMKKTDYWLIKFTDYEVLRPYRGESQDS